MNIVQDNWDKILDKIKQEYCSSNIAYRTFVAPLTVYEETDDTIYIFVEQSASIDHLELKYKLPFAVSVTEVVGKEYEIMFVTDDEQVVENKKEEVENNLKMDAIYRKANLYGKYTFDSFVVGKNSEFAAAAAKAISENPGMVHNPLFLYGGVGLGKTHLMHSIGHKVLTDDPTKKVLYVTSESFTNELIDSIKVGKVDDELAMVNFRNKYRNNDVLLIDDIQFIIGKTQTQEEFFNTFCHLQLSDKAVIISSDCPPNEIKNLDDRLRTRFGSGLIADVSSPDYETRVAILRKKIDVDNLENYNIPKAVIEYIANNVKTNIRELEGSLNRLISLVKLEGKVPGDKEITIPLAAEAIKNYVDPDSKRMVTDDYILEVVSEHFNIPVSDIVSPKRSANITTPRHCVMYLCRAMIDSPFKNIGIMLGGRDHSTVMHGFKKMEAEIKTNETLRNTINTIRKKVSPL
jgi:chromosomal replication initiator protein